MAGLLYIALGGAIGAVLRYIISGIPHSLFPGTFPWGTALVNLTGSFFIGFLSGILFNRMATISPDMRKFVFIGILGAFTTFSTFSIESLRLLNDGEITLAVSNIMLNNIGGIVLALAGYTGGKALMMFTG
ncbi:MAG: fluoride efflux transporter CrcB [Spirochaetota bacterium]